MKKAIALFLFATQLFAVDSSQIKKKSDGSVVGDSASAVKVNFYRSTTAPVSPLSAGDVWCDTNYTPCLLKIYDGSAWNTANSQASVTTQTDFSAGFPSSPSEGNWIWDKANKVPWLYLNTGTSWYRTDDGLRTTTNPLFESFSGSTISAPGAGMTGADGGGGGNFDSTTGAHQHTCAVTFANSTGGETTTGGNTGTITLTTGNARKITFSSIPTGGAGTTQRRIYCSKINTSTPLYWIGTINDNSTTSQTLSGLTDANMLITAPDRNYSAPLNVRWAVTNNTAQTTSGGCGSTGSSMVCKASASGTIAKATANDLTVTASTSIAAWSQSTYVIQYRVVKMEGAFTGGFPAKLAFGGLSIGAGWATGPQEFDLAAAGTLVGPLSATNVFSATSFYRTSSGLAATDIASGSGSMERISAFPFWVKIVKSGNQYMPFYSREGTTWVPLTVPTTLAAATDAALSLNATLVSPQYDTLFFDLASSVAAQDADIEIDTLTLISY